MRQKTPIETAREFESLLERARQGKPEALNQLFKDSWKPLERFCRSLCPRPLARRFDHLDAVQETLLLAAKDFPDFRGMTREELENWLKVIARTVIGTLRRKHLSPIRDARLEVSIDRPKARSSLVQDSWIDADPDLRRVRYKGRSILVADWWVGAPGDRTWAKYVNAWNAIGEIYQWSLFWTRVEKCSFEELARNQNMTPDATRRRYERASRAMRAELKNYGLS